MCRCRCDRAYHFSPRRLHQRRLLSIEIATRWSRLQHAMMFHGNRSSGACAASDRYAFAWFALRFDAARPSRSGA